MKLIKLNKCSIELGCYVSVTVINLRPFKVKQIPKIRANFGRGCVGPGLILKKIENRPKIILYYL